MDNYEICKKLKISGFRHLFDDGANEYNSVKMDAKLSVLGRIVLFGYDFNKIIKEYKENRADYIIKRIKPTLIGYISYLETGVTYDFEISNNLKNKSEKVVVIELINCIKEKLFKKYNIENLINSYVKHKFEYDSQEYEQQKQFFKIDFDKDIHKELSKRRKEEGLQDTIWSYSEAYTLLVTTLFSSTKNNEYLYLNTEVQMPFSQTMKFLTNIHLPKSIQKKFISDSNYRKEKIMDFAKSLVEIVYFDKPLFDFETYFIRHNFGDSFSKKKEELFEKNLVGILVDQDYEKQDWKRIESGLKINNSKSTFIRSWFSFQNQVLEKNVIIVSSYPNQSKFKIGLISKGSKFFELKTNSDFKVFQMDNVVDIDKKDIPIFNAIIPQQNTLSPIHKRKNFVIYKYLGVEIPVMLENLSENSIELLCAEWLRSDFVSKENRIKSQLLRTGGNYAKADMVGLTEKEKKVVAQVSFTDNKNQILNKISNLSKMKADKYFMFCLETEITNENVEIVFIEKVFSDLNNDKFYKKIIEELIRN